MNRLELLDRRNYHNSTADLIANLPEHELWELMGDLNKELARLGVTESISTIIWAGQTYGCNFEDVHPKSGVRAKATPLNCFVSLLSYQPELRQKLSKEDFGSLAGIVAMVSQTSEQLMKNGEKFEWPIKFQNPPS